MLVTQLCPNSVTPWTVARQALLSMGFFRQEYWSGLPFTFGEDLSHLQRLLPPTSPPRMELLSLALQANSLLSGDFLIAQLVKNPPVNAEVTGDAGLIPEWRRFPEGGN